MLLNPYRFRQQNPNAASLLAALRSWWTMDENAATPTYEDSHGANPLTLRTGASLTNTSTISGTTLAKLGRAATLANTQDRVAYIPRSNTALDLPNGNFSFGGWMTINLGVVGAAAFVMGRVGSNTSAIQAYLYIEGSPNDLRAAATTDGTITTRVQTTGFSSSVWSASELQLIVLTFNRSANLLEIRLRRPGFASGALQKQTVAFPGALHTASSAANFTVAGGLSSDATFFSSNRCGIITADECFFVDKAITDDEMEYLYNSGAGRSYAALLADGS